MTYRAIIIAHNQIALKTIPRMVSKFDNNPIIIPTPIVTALDDVHGKFEAAIGRLGEDSQTLCILEANAGQNKATGTTNEVFVFAKYISSMRYRHCQFVFFTTTPTLVDRINGPEFSSYENAIAVSAVKPDHIITAGNQLNRAIGHTQSHQQTVTIALLN